MRTSLKRSQNHVKETCGKWVINELFGRLKKDDLSINASPMSPGQLASIISLIQSEEISGKLQKFRIVYVEGGDPNEIVDSRGMKQVTDTSAIKQ